MAGPLIATVVVAKLVDRVAWRDAVGLRFRGRWHRLALWTPLAVLLIVALNAATAVLMVLRGVPGDLSGRTWAGIVTDQFAEAGAEMPTSAAIALVLLSTAIGVLVTAVPAFGEEVGWRGWLWPRLKPLGLLGGVIVGGVIWSLWHLPVTLIGYNYPGAPRPAAIGMFVLACIAMNLLFGAITERVGGNPIPAAFAHATLNSTLGLALGIVSTQETPAAMNPFVDTPLGLIGIVLMAAAGLLILPRGTGDRPAALPDAAA
ncbi:CPBP family intramembrane glutamic endopeptidase [Brachybacterium sp. YJGR34]|uniref:CPBP family intramembrane glutamic endopeptidase n=1 Tax=Brachybacterium sp. YJGR34 TaxID=2059911 RepID=UPI000E0CB896|nr:CPBP family intramembrane glutamic endopeptidase [Brachybacterium sp. YJGR34]